MKIFKKLLSITLFFVIGYNHIYCQTTNTPTVSKELKPYYDFVRQCNTSSIDYIIELFEKYDVVILGERDHRDTTQYEFICRLISDPRFNTRIKNILTEIGNVNYTSEANQLIQTTWTSDAVFRQHLIHLLQNATFSPYWEKYNFPKLLTHLYRCNSRKKDSAKLNIYFTDVPFSWDSITTTTTYRYFEKNKLALRDSIMAYHAKIFLDTILEKGGKALIIYNEPHARIYKSERTTSAAFYIAKYFPGRIANVRLNDVEFGRRDSERSDRLIEHGKWDAAFQINGNKSIGFNLKSSPFGKDQFHSLGNRKVKNAKHEDVYTGYIFYQPVCKWVATNGYPGVITEEFIKELNRRLSIINGKKTKLDSNIYKEYNTIKSTPIYDSKMQKRFSKKINRLLH